MDLFANSYNRCNFDFAFKKIIYFEMPIKIGTFCFDTRRMLTLFLKINGTDVSKYIATQSITHNIIWSTNAGRTLSGNFVGDIVTRKWKIVLTTKPLSQKESAEFAKLVESGAFFNVQFIPPNSESGGMKTITVYSDEPSWEIYSYVIENARYKSIGISFVEQ